MNRTIKNSGIKLTIFFVTSLFAMTFLIQSTAHGQAPLVRPPRVGPKPTPLIINPNLASAMKNPLPDLQIADIKYDAKNCTVYIRVANKGSKDAGTFNVWVELDGYYPFGQTKSFTGLAANDEMWLDYSLIPAASKSKNPYANLGSLGQGPAKDKCRLDALIKVRAVVDARYFYVETPRIPTAIGSVGGVLSAGLLPLGATAPAKTSDQITVTVFEPQVAEFDENNNELTVNKGDMKLYP